MHKYDRVQTAVPVSPCEIVSFVRVAGTSAEVEFLPQDVQRYVGISESVFIGLP